MQKKELATWKTGHWKFHCQRNNNNKNEQSKESPWELWDTM